MQDPVLPDVFHKDLTESDPIPDEGVSRAVDLMRSGRLTRYGETGGEPSEAALLEAEFAAYVGRRYAVAVNSGASAIFLALKALDVGRGDGVLLNSFTLAPVPGAIEHAGARTVLVETTDDLVIDLADLERKAPQAKVLLLSHMRGHIADLAAVAAICDRHGLALIEDCAHTIGGGWDGRLTGSFGVAGCFSAQTFKHLNSGEGGLLATDDEDMAAKAILYAGSYRLYGQHLAGPGPEVFARHEGSVPNLSLRMTSLAAAVLRPQLPLLAARVERWNRLYAGLAGALAEVPHVRVPDRDPREQFVGSSIQFFLTGLDAASIERVLDACDSRGLHIKWFGRREARGFTSSWRHWEYLTPSELPETRSVLDSLCDLRIPLSLEEDESAAIARILGEAIGAEAR